MGVFVKYKLMLTPTDSGSSHSPITPTKPKAAPDKERPTKGWWTELKSLSNFVLNFEWKRTFWKDQTSAKTTYILASKGKEGVQRPAQL